jgi:hypothetical protein
MSSEAEQITALQAQVAALLNETIPSLQEQIDLTSTAADDMWVILCAVLVFLMQGGFAMLEVGAVREKNVTVCSFLVLCFSSHAASLSIRISSSKMLSTLPSGPSSGGGLDLALHLARPKAGSSAHLSLE